MRYNKIGVTLLELIIVVMIISILSTIAVTVYTGQVERARFAAAKATIAQIQTACQRYEIDLGVFPTSGTQGITAPTVGALNPNKGCGWMTLMLLHSANNNATAPADNRWNGPYLELNADKLGDLSGVVGTANMLPGAINILDPWGLPYQYVRFNDYTTWGGTKLRSNDPFFATETYYNVNTVQIFSKGPNGTTLPIPDSGLNISTANGTETDDVSNFGTK